MPLDTMVQLRHDDVVAPRNTLPKPLGKRERNRLRRTLKSSRGSIVALAKQLGVTQGALSNWLAGRSDSSRIQAAVQFRCAEIEAEQAEAEAPPRAA